MTQKEIVNEENQVVITGRIDKVKGIPGAERGRAVRFNLRQTAQDSHIVNFYPCSAVGDVAEQLQKLPDGALVTLHGFLRRVHWNDRDSGVRLHDTQVVADRVVSR